MVSALVSVITYLMIGMFVATFLEVLENKHPKTIFADIALGKEGTDWYYFFIKPRSRKPLPLTVFAGFLRGRN